MMMNNPSENNNFEARQEGGDGNNNSKESKLSSITRTPSTSTATTSTRSSSRQWGGFKNPRIVRMSRSFGGKDRHSKVCTIRGLRDRRIRLSVPTAIQLYDLQDRLGLSQPSKVVDWLLDATQFEIDKLPPLQFPPNSFPIFDNNIPNHHHHHHQQSLPLHFSHHHHDHHQDQETSGLRMKEKWIEENQDESITYNNNNGVVLPHHHQISAQNFFPLGNQSCFPSNLLSHNNSTTTLPYNYSYYHLEPSSLSLAQFHHSQNNLYFPSILPVPPPYTAAAAAVAPGPVPPEADPHHLSTHFWLNSSAMIKSYAKDLSSLPDNNNNPEKSNRGS